MIRHVSSDRPHACHMYRNKKALQIKKYKSEKIKNWKNQKNWKNIYKKRYNYETKVIFKIYIIL